MVAAMCTLYVLYEDSTITEYNQQKIRIIKLMEEQKDKLERIYQKLNEEEDTVLKKWNESIIPKIILLFPSIAFALTFLKVNTDKSILDLLIFIVVGGLLVAGGIFLNYFLSKGK